MNYNIEHIKNLLMDMYDNNSSRLSYSLTHSQEWQEIEAITDNIASCNAQMKEHPIDSMIHVLQNPDLHYTTPIEDEALSRFITNALIVSIIQLAIIENSGCEWYDAIQYCYDNGFFTRLAAYGRHAASDDYRDTIETMKSLGLWVE